MIDVYAYDAENGIYLGPPGGEGNPAAAGPRCTPCRWRDRIATCPYRGCGCIAGWCYWRRADVTLSDCRRCLETSDALGAATFQRTITTTTGPRSQAMTETETEAKTEAKAEKPAAVPAAGTLTLRAGEARAASARFTAADSAPAPPPGEVLWESSHPDVVAVVPRVPDGTRVVLVAGRPGAATVAAASSRLAARLDVVVESPATRLEIVVDPRPASGGDDGQAEVKEAQAGSWAWPATSPAIDWSKSRVHSEQLDDQ